MPSPFAWPAEPGRTRECLEPWGATPFECPAYYDFDFALIKDAPVRAAKSRAERVDLQFRAEFFDLFDIVTMGLPANTLTGSGFGQISKTAGNSRQIRFSLKMIY